MIDEPSSEDGDGLEAAVRMRRKSRNRGPVIHPPTVFARKVLAEVAPREGARRPHLLIAFGVSIVVVYAKQKRVRSGPWKAERRKVHDRFDWHKVFRSGFASAKRTLERWPDRYAANVLPDRGSIFALHRCFAMQQHCYNNSTKKTTRQDN